jgi:hypothetical protein
MGMERRRLEAVTSVAAIGVTPDPAPDYMR